MYTSSLFTIIAPKQILTLKFLEHIKKNKKDIRNNVKNRKVPEPIGIVYSTINSKVLCTGSYIQTGRCAVAGIFWNFHS